MAETTSWQLSSTSDVAKHIVLDPFTCLAKKNQKYAKECTEVVLSNQEGEELSDNFKRFPNLEVVWFNCNRLNRLQHLESNFRIREVFVQDNRLVCLRGLQHCKFLRVLLASNNQIKNLDKQLAFLSRFGFLRKLELYGNPLADELEYRLRFIHDVPQLQIFDHAAIKPAERTKAKEVVPNLDNVDKLAVRRRRAKSTVSKVEQDLFRESHRIRETSKRREEEALDEIFGLVDKSESANGRTFFHKTFHSNAQAWSTPRELMAREVPRQTAWEAVEMQEHVEMIAGKQDLTRADVIDLCGKLSQQGVEDYGRSLTRPDVFSALPLSARNSTRPVTAETSEGKLPPTSARGKEQPKATTKVAEGGKDIADAKCADGKAAHPLQALQDPEASLPAKDVAKYLLTLDWHRHNSATLGKRITKLYETARHAELSGRSQEQTVLQTSALRLEGVRDRLADALAEKERTLGSARKSRVDFFKQSLLRPRRLEDELTGGMTLRVSAEDRSTTIGS
mmetsp:Transcript_7883/g.12856  ORF Transcript_7883/g.12856 Transcript_7883/m.12856 type:complete len:508 (-) Transcript_7883:59-1582(-)